ncbi:MAG: DMT family transporter [Treponema sp.]|uniref:DMT family transporter n=1 Tax=Treponema sp. TaxID=166 RepID=UPI0025F890AF|nr:DMT family transporter [Treponema sp.]MBQ8678642.1 DMT family transporter [Treponema sp.]
MLKKSSLVGLIFASLSVFMWGITFVSTKYLLRSFSAFEILVLRFFLAYLGLWILRPKSLHLEDKKNEIYFALAGFSGVTAYQFMENMAISYTSASNVSIIVSICPIFTAIFSQIFLKEKHLTPTFLLGFLLAIFGIALVSFNGVVILHLSPKGDLLALGAAVLWGVYSVCVSKINALGLDSIQATRRIFLWALLFMIPIGLFSIMTLGTFPVSTPDFKIPGISLLLDSEFNHFRFLNPLNWLNLAFLGLGASAFCFAAWNIACERLGTVRATVGIYLIPVVTIIFAFFALGENISLMGAIGAVITIAGLFVSEIKKDD